MEGFYCKQSCSWPWCGTTKRRIKNCRCKCERLGIHELSVDENQWVYSSDGMDRETSPHWTAEMESDQKGRRRIVAACIDKCGEVDGHLEPKEWVCESFGMIGLYNNSPLSYLEVAEKIGCNSDGFMIPENAEDIKSVELEKLTKEADKKNKIIFFMILAVAVVVIIQLVLGNAQK